MNEASQWRQELARRIAPVYIDHGDVRVVEVGGSVSRGCADRYSDIELGVFWDEPPTDDARRDAAQRAGGVLWRAFEFANDEWTEEFVVQGVKIDVSHRLVSSMEGWLCDVVDRCDTNSTKQNLVSAIQHAIPVQGAPLLAQWQAKAAKYPDSLAEAMVREHLFLGPQQWLEMLAERGSTIELIEIFCRIEKRLLGVLMGLNHVYHPGFKWLDRLIGDLPIAPHELGNRLKRIFQLDPREGVREIGLLVAETYALVDKLMPHVDTGPARERLSQTRPVCDQPPPFL